MPEWVGTLLVCAAWCTVGLLAGIKINCEDAEVILSRGGRLSDQPSAVRSQQSEILNPQSAIETRRVSLHPAEKVRPTQPAPRGRGGFSTPCPSRLELISPPPTPFERRVVRALWGVETTSGRNLAPGDGGAARGHLQQHEGHWDRGCEYLGVDWPWPDDAHDYDKAEAIAIANWRRDGWPKFEMFMAEQFARRFRLPNAPYRACNDEYWEKVSRELREQNKRELAAEARRTQR